MAEVVGNSVVKEVSDPDIDHVTALCHRRIEFHLERKPFKGFIDEGNDGFKLETLNPTSSDCLNKSDPHKSISGAVSGSGKVLERSNHGLDPELSFRIYFRRIGAGLQNLGNTCFLNSVLQCLTYTEPLAAYLQSGRHKNSCRAAGFCALCAIQKHVSRALESTGRILVPKDLVSNLRCISRNFRNARQEDAHEYMVNLLESMHKCCIPSGVPSESPSAYEKSLVHMIFGGRLRSQVKCLQCSFCSNKFDPFLDLSLEIVKADSLAKALANFTAQEQLDGGARQYQCQQCKQKVRALKQLTVHKAPEVLTIHLKRFASHAPGVKIDKKIDFPTALDLKRYVTGPHDGNLNYTLYGVLVHAGWSTHSGHYYCFVRTSSGMWYCLDDNQVVQVSEGKVLQQKAYMLFYVRDRRNSAPKKTVDVLQRDNVVMKALGNKVCNNFKLGLEEPNQSESIEKKSRDLVSCTVAQSQVSDTDLINRSGMKTDSAPNVCGPSEKTSISNSTLSMASEKVNGTNPIPKAPLTRVGERVNGTDPSGPGFLSLKKDHVTESSLKVPAVSYANGSPMPNVTAGSCVVKAVPFFHNNLSLDKSVQNDHNELKDSAKNLNDGVLKSSTASWEANNGRDHNGAVDEHSNSVGIPRFCSGTSSLTSTTKTMQDEGVSEVAGVSELHSSVGSGQGEYKQPVRDLGRKSKEKKLHGVKRRAFKPQTTTRLHLGSSFTFGASLGRRKKHKRGRKHSMAKVDVQPVPSDTGPSTSKKAEIVHNICSAHSPKGKKVDASTKLIGSIGSSVIDEDSRKPVNQSCNSTAKLLLQKTSVDATKELPDLRESSGPEHLKTVHAKTETMSVAVGGLNDVPVPRWDGLEPVGPSDWVESGLTDGFSIGYVADEWDEEFDRGKRKKVRQSKPEFDGYNPFQEIASRRSKTKKSKRDHRR